MIGKVGSGAHVRHSQEDQQNGERNQRNHQRSFRAHPIVLCTSQARDSRCRWQLVALHEAHIDVIFES